MYTEAKLYVYRGYILSYMYTQELMSRPKGGRSVLMRCASVLRISPYKGSVATVQIEMSFHAIMRSWTLLPLFGRLISSWYTLYVYRGYATFEYFLNATR